MTDARTDLRDARLRIAHEMARAGASAADIVAELSASTEDVLLLLIADPHVPTPGSSRARAERFEREWEGCQRRLAAATDDQLAMVLDMDRLRLKMSSAPPRRLSRDADR